MCVVKITEKNCVLNSAFFKYQHDFVEAAILGHKFDGISLAFISLSQFGVCPDLLEIKREPITITYGPNDQDLDIESIDVINRVGGLGIKILN